MTGIVYKSTGSWYTVKTKAGIIYKCRIKGKFRVQDIKSTNPVAVGDRVAFNLENVGGETIGMIDTIHDRKNYIIRKSVNLSKRTHIIAANLDQVFLIVTLKNPPTYPLFIDRFLVTAEAYHVETILLFNKIDSYTEQELQKVRSLAAIYQKAGYKCRSVSAKTMENIADIKTLMEGKTSMFSGHSGVGKSTLINAIEPELALRTAAISPQHHQGQHTTTFAEMFDLQFDAQIIDTPGIKGFGVVAMKKEEIRDYLPEFFALKSQCKFHNCLHIDEPKCAIKDAVMQDKIAQSRYKSYLQLIQDDDTHYRTAMYKE